MVNKVLIIILLTEVCCHFAAGVEFNYNLADTTYGPNAWAETYPQSCNGSRQSPIDIVTSRTTYDSSLGALTFTNYDTIPDGSTIQLGNNGYSFRVFFRPHVNLVTGGGLPGTFYTHNFHFHWGSVNTRGSEHEVDGNKYPAEIWATCGMHEGREKVAYDAAYISLRHDSYFYYLLHFVLVNTKYPNTTVALQETDGIAALGVILEVGDENPALKPFFKYIVNLTRKMEIKNVTATQILRPLLPNNTSEFYRYNGSLTTPKCQEAVTWTLFKNHQTISQEQLNMLRTLKQADNVTALTDTFRPVQPLNSRVVKRSFEALPPTTGPTSGAYHVSNTMATVVSVVMAIVMFNWST